MENYYNPQPNQQPNNGFDYSVGSNTPSDDEIMTFDKMMSEGKKVEEQVYEVKDNMPVERQTSNLQPKPSSFSGTTQRYNVPIQVGGSSSVNRHHPQYRQAYAQSPNRPQPMPNQEGIDVNKLLASLKEKDQIIEQLKAQEQEKSQAVEQLTEKLIASENACLEQTAANEEQSAKIEKLEADNETLTKRVDIIKSDWDNYRRRTEENREKDRVLACEGIVKSLLQAIDDIERSIEYAYQYETDADSLIEGNKAILRRIITILEDYDVHIIDVTGEFDANVHCAIGREKVEDVEPGAIVKVVQTGYILGDKVIRPASVIVSY